MVVLMGTIGTNFEFETLRPTDYNLQRERVWLDIEDNVDEPNIDLPQARSSRIRRLPDRYGVYVKH